MKYTKPVISQEFACSTFEAALPTVSMQAISLAAEEFVQVMTITQILVLVKGFQQHTYRGLSYPCYKLAHSTTLHIYHVHCIGMWNDVPKEWNAPVK